MVDYTIYVLDEGDLTVTSPTGLDGVTQGDGSHLNGQTLTITSGQWTPIEITDNDVNFSDNDSSQVLNGAQEVDGVTYADGTRLEAEFAFTASYNGESWTMIAFNVRNSSTSYATIEGIAVIGGPGDFPPVGVPLALSGAQEGPSFAAAAYATPICFDAGCPILTPGGYRRVDCLRAGDLVVTGDDGALPVLWIGRRRVFGIGPFAPVEIAAGALGNGTALRVSQQHRVLVRGAAAELLFGEAEVLVPARALVGRPGVRLAPGRRVAYHHVLVDRHALLDCAGMMTESFLPSAFGLAQLSETARAELLTAYPWVARRPWRPVRPILRSYEAVALAAA